MITRESRDRDGTKHVLIRHDQFVILKLQINA
jgi:hypothetical protein